MKTIKEHFESLDEPYKSEAINNSIETHIGLRERPTIHQSLSSAFTWHDTDQGHVYWAKLYNQLRKQGK